MRRTYHELTIRCPEGLELNEELLQIAREAAESALRDIAGLQAKVKELQDLGIQITLAELLRKRRGPAAGVSSDGPSPRRARLSAAAKEEILAAFKTGTAATELAKRHGCALGSIMNLKRQAGLTRPRKRHAEA